MPEWSDFVQHEYEMLGKLFLKYDDNHELGCDKVDINVDDKYDSDSFHVTSLQSSDSSDNEVVDKIETIMKPKKSKKRQNKHHHYPTFNPNTKMEHIEFEPCMIFTSREQLTDAIRNYSVARQRRLFLNRSDSKRMQAKYREGCKMELWASRMVNQTYPSVSYTHLTLPTIYSV